MAKGGKRVGAGRPGIPGGGEVICAKVAIELRDAFDAVCADKGQSRSERLALLVQADVNRSRNAKRARKVTE